jgi:hypothetical protein
MLTWLNKRGAKMKNEIDPTGRTPHDPGAKLDDGKLLAGVLLDFSLALTEVAKVGTYGAKKYSRRGCLEVPNGIERYQDAMMRHLLAAQREDIDEDSGLLHDAQVCWNALIRLELKLRGETR